MKINRTKTMPWDYSMRPEQGLRNDQGVKFQPRDPDYRGLPLDEKRLAEIKKRQERRERKFARRELRGLIRLFVEDAEPVILTPEGELGVTRTFDGKRVPEGYYPARWCGKNAVRNNEIVYLVRRNNLVDGPYTVEKPDGDFAANIVGNPDSKVSHESSLTSAGLRNRKTKEFLPLSKPGVKYNVVRKL